MKKSLPIVIVAALLLSSLWLAAGSPPGEEKRVPKYVGTKGCRVCHKGEKIGNQYGLWAESAHAHAYETLKTSRADSLARTLGIENPVESDRCLKCHITAFGVPEAQLSRGYAREEGVQCEACHGPGSLYRPLKIMRDHQKAVENGLWVLGEKGCVSCHHQAFSFIEEFNFERSMKRIAHPVPPEDTTAVEPAPAEAGHPPKS